MKKNFPLPRFLVTILILIGCVFLAFKVVNIFTAKQKETYTIKIGNMSFPTPFLIAQEKGFFSQESLNVEIVEFTNTDTLVQALLNGDIDTAVIPYASLLNVQIAAPGSFKIYFSAEESDNHPFSYLVVKNDINNIEELNGKKIVIRTGYPSKVQAEWVFKGLGLNPQNITFVQVATPLIVPTFSQADVFACLDLEPIMTVITQQGQGKVLVVAPRSKYLVNPYPSAAGVFSSNFVQEHPNLAMKLMKSIDTSIDYMKTNEADSRLIFQKELNLDENIAQKMQLPWFEKLDAIDRKAIQMLIDFSVENNILETRPNFDDAFFEK